MPDSIASELEIPDIDEGAQMLIEMDQQLQKWVKEVDKLADKAFEGLPDRELSELVTDCEVNQAAIPVSNGFKALQFGTLKVAFKALPRLAEKFIHDQMLEAGEKAGAYVLARKAAKKIPGIGLVVSVAIGAVTASEWMDEMEAGMHEVLGCEPSEVEKLPMRYALNEMVRQMKTRKENAPRPIGPVRTRHK